MGSENIVMLSMPKGIILPWYSRQGPVPDGWAICDGSQGTPDLRQRFLKGVSDFNDVGQPGGAAQHQHSFSGTGSTGAPGHTAQGPDQPNQEEFGSRIHTHSVVVNGTTAPESSYPPCVAVLFIMKL
jgi:hypothetical protein